MTLQNDLRMYVEDTFSAVGENECSTTMSLAADRIDELDKCLAEWLSANCETGWIGELRAHAKASVSYMQERDTLKARIDELEKQVARLKTVPMKYRRMEFNAQLQKELEAKQARIDKLEGAI